MFRLLAHRRRHVWIAVLAVLWQALLPLSNAFPGVPAAGERIPVCTASGLKWVVANDDASSEPSAHQDRTHCALCFFDDEPALHVARDLLLIVPSEAKARIATTASLPYPIHRSTTPPSRAPPAVI